MTIETKGFWNFLRHAKWDFQNKKFHYKQAFYSWIPGDVGFILRYRLYKKYLKAVGEETIFYEGVYIRNPQNLSLGHHCAIGVDNAFQAAGHLIIGDYVIFGPGVKIWTSNHIYADPNVPILEQGSEFKEVSIGDDTWIAANAFIMPGAKIGKGCVISAGAVVGAKLYKDYSILAGNPARVIGFRNQQTPTAPPSSASGKEE
jgi:acetyltransferase-like isoleucine patch superfamily enzyme